MFKFENLLVKFTSVFKLNVVCKKNHMYYHNISREFCQRFFEKNRFNLTTFVKILPSVDYAFKLPVAEIVYNRFIAVICVNYLSHGIFCIFAVFNYDRKSDLGVVCGIKSHNG